VLTVAGDPLEKLVVCVITDAGESGRTVGTITQSCRYALKRFQAMTVVRKPFTRRSAFACYLQRLLLSRSCQRMYRGRRRLNKQRNCLSRQHCSNDRQRLLLTYRRLVIAALRFTADYSFSAQFPSFLADCRETLPYDRKCTEFYYFRTSSPNLPPSPPQKLTRAKTSNLEILDLIPNISRTEQDIDNKKGAANHKHLAVFIN